MAKKKENAEEPVTNLSSREEQIQQLNKELTKDYGNEVLISGDFFLEKPQVVIPISPALDSITGGIPEGSSVIITGYEKIGKSLTCLAIAANAQKEEYGNRFVCYIDAEARIKPMNLKGIKGLKTDPMHFQLIQSTENKIMSSQDMLNAGLKVLHTVPRCVLIVDSYSMLSGEKALAEGLGTSDMGKSAQIVTDFCRQASTLVRVKNSILIGVTHQAVQIGGYGGSRDKGARAIQFAGDVKLKGWVKEHIKVGGEGNEKVIGQRVEWTAEYSALGYAPKGKAISIIRYGIGIDELGEMIDFGIDFGLIEKAGAWYTCSFMKNHIKEWNDTVEKQYKAQGQEKLYALLEGNQEAQDALYKEIKVVIK